MGKKKYGHLGDRTRCRLCRERIREVDYKNVDLLEKCAARNGKIASRKRTGTCARHQRQIKEAVKRARFVGFMPYIST
ncbi:MAG TPA: 30S ribosomal protein S18 [Planctomycetes bacterium]|nr:30S ribosomal protein S18 [Planctomycetota bacterium]